MHENFFHKIKVYYEDTDSGGVVYYANYLKFFERARTEALYSIGYSNRKIKDDFKSLIIVKSCNVEYRKPARLEDELVIRSFALTDKIPSKSILKVTAIKGSSFFAISISSNKNFPIKVFFDAVSSSP